MIDLSFRYHRWDQNDPPAPIAASKGKKAEQIFGHNMVHGTGSFGVCYFINLLRFMIDLSFRHPRRNQNGSLGTNRGYILAGTADNGEILGKIFGHNMDHMAGSFGVRPRTIPGGRTGGAGRGGAGAPMGLMEWGGMVEPGPRTGTFLLDSWFSGNGRGNGRRIGRWRGCGGERSVAFFDEFLEKGNRS